MPTHAPATNLPAPMKATPAAIRAAVEQGFLDFAWRYGTRPWLSVRDAAAAIGRVSTAGVVNAEYVISLIEAGEIGAMKHRSFDRTNADGADKAERFTWRVDAASLRWFIARTYTLPPDMMMVRAADYLRQLPAPELRKLAVSALALAEMKEARK